MVLRNTGKDFIAARLILWFLFTHTPSIVIATGPTARQVNEIVWGELTQAYLNAVFPLGGRLLSNKLEVDEKRRWYSMGFTTKDAAKGGVGKFQGFHQESVMVVMTEAQAIEKPIWDQAESLRTAGKFRMLVIGNPLVAYGEFYSGSPYLGDFGVRPVGAGNANTSGGYFHMFHSHNEREVVNGGIFPGGMMTMMVIEPPGVTIDAGQP